MKTKKQSKSAIDPMVFVLFGKCLEQMRQLGREYAKLRCQYGICEHKEHRENNGR